MKILFATTSKEVKQPSLYKNLSFLFVLFLFQICSCTTINSIAESEHIHIIDNVPFYPQEDYQCGPASLASVLNYWGVDITPDEIAQEIFSKSARGTLTIDMVLYPEKKDLKSIHYSGNIEDLKNHIDLDHPMIVLVDQGFFFYQANHFIIVIGHSEHGMIVNSGENRHLFIPLKDFLKAWSKTGFWTLLIKKE